MKTWEETWSCDGRTIDVQMPDERYDIADFHMYGASWEDDEARAQLAACAPELYRMVEELTSYPMSADLMLRAVQLLAKSRGE